MDQNCVTYKHILFQSSTLLLFLFLFLCSSRSQFFPTFILIPWRVNSRSDPWTGLESMKKKTPAAIYPWVWTKHKYTGEVFVRPQWVLTWPHGPQSARVVHRILSSVAVRNLQIRGTPHNRRWWSSFVFKLPCKTISFGLRVKYIRAFPLLSQ